MSDTSQAHHGSTTPGSHYQPALSVVLIIVVLFVVAAVKVNPQDASGLDGALKSLAALPFGEAILLIVGIGLIAYGLYSFAYARLARL